MRGTLRKGEIMSPERDVRSTSGAFCIQRVTVLSKRTPLKGSCGDQFLVEAEEPCGIEALALEATGSETRIHASPLRVVPEHRTHVRGCAPRGLHLMPLRPCARRAESLPSIVQCAAVGRAIGSHSVTLDS